MSDAYAQSDTEVAADNDDAVGDTKAVEVGIEGLESYCGVQPCLEVSIAGLYSMNHIDIAVQGFLKVGPREQILVVWVPYETNVLHTHSA